MRVTLRMWSMAVMLACHCGIAPAQDAPADGESGLAATMPDTSADANPAGEQSGAAPAPADVDQAAEPSAEASAPAEAQVPTIAVPQAAAAPIATASEANSTTVLDEVQVTAQRKVSTVQETPISIEAFNGEKLQLRGIDGLNGLAANVPSMTIQPFPTHNDTLIVFIRGIGNSDAQVTQDPAVGIYLDGVYIARSVGLAVDTADLERIEVLRGPQGTLYGRNSTGGAINLITKRPAPGAFSMTHQLTAGDRNTFVGKSSFNVPIGSDLAAKLAVYGTTHDGFVKNTGEGGDFSDQRESAVRFDLRWLPEDWLTADYSYDQTELRYYNAMFQAQLPPNSNKGTAEIFKRYAQQKTVYSDRRLAALASDAPLEPSGSHIRGHALILGAPLGDSYELKYIGSYRKLIDDEYVDLSGGSGSPDYRLDTNAYSGPAATMAHGGPTPLMVPQVFQHQMSHELQFSGKAFDDSLEFIAGAYYFSESGGEHGSPIHHIASTRVDPQQTAALFDASPLLEQSFLALAAPRLVIFWEYEYRIRNLARAVFTQTTWSPEYFQHQLHFTAGLRKSWDQREATKTYAQSVYAEGQTALGSLTALQVPQAALAGNDIFSDIRSSRSFSDLSPSANLQYDLSNLVTTYISYQRAYKSGGFNLRDPQISGASGNASDGTNYGFGFVEGFKPEFVSSYEAGVKSEWFDHRLRWNADIFQSFFRDMQVNFVIPGTLGDTKTRNAGRAKMRGLETELSFVAAQGLILGFDYSYLDARVTEVIDVNGNNVASVYPFFSAPKDTFVDSIDWTFLHAGWGDLRAYASYNYVGKREGSVVSEQLRGLNRLASYGLVNARLQASGVHLGSAGMLDISLWGKNLLDKVYPVFAIDNLPQSDRSVIWGDPRSFGLDLVYRY